MTEPYHQPSAEDEAGLRAAYAAIPAAPVTRSHRVDRVGPLAEAVREQLRRERRERAELERTVETLRHDIATLRGEVAVEKRVADLLDRIARLEASSRGGPLRSVSSS
jgi:hypothetical protein